MSFIFLGCCSNLHFLRLLWNPRETCDREKVCHIPYTHGIFSRFCVSRVKVPLVMILYRNPRPYKETRKPTVLPKFHDWPQMMFHSTVITKFLFLASYSGSEPRFVTFSNHVRWGIHRLHHFTTTNSIHCEFSVTPRGNNSVWTESTTVLVHFSPWKNTNPLIFSRKKLSEVIFLKFQFVFRRFVLSVITRKSVVTGGNCEDYIMFLFCQLFGPVNHR